MYLKPAIESLFRLTGVMAALLAWIVIILAIQYNPWFQVTKHAFSDLGGPSAEEPLIFNYGLITMSILTSLYAIALIKNATNKAETVGGAFMIITGIFLALIGVYPSGTEPHTFISIWFFVQADITVIAWGIGLLLRGWKRTGIISLGMGIGGPLITPFINWPSIAVLEAYGIILINAWVILMLKVLRPSMK